MSRLQDIVARNVEGKKTVARKVTFAIVGVAFVILAILSTCTSLGRPKDLPPTPKPPKADHVDGIYLRAPPAKK